MDPKQDERPRVWDEAEHNQIMLGYFIFFLIYVPTLYLANWLLEKFSMPAVIEIPIILVFLGTGILLCRGVLGELGRKSLHENLKRKAELKDIEALYRTVPDSVNDCGNINNSSVVQAGQIYGDVNFNSSDGP